MYEGRNLIGDSAEDRGYEDIIKMDKMLLTRYKRLVINSNGQLL
jgi:hypothetical protein